MGVLCRGGIRGRLRSGSSDKNFSTSKLRSSVGVLERDMARICDVMINQNVGGAYYEAAGAE